MFYKQQSPLWYHFSNFQHFQRVEILMTSLAHSWQPKWMTWSVPLNWESNVPSEVIGRMRTPVYGRHFHTGYASTWIEPMVVINSQPWGIIYWLVFKRLPVQTTYLFLQDFWKYFYSQEMLTTSEIKFKLHLILTLSVQLQTIMTFYEENYGQNKEFVSVKRCTCLFTNMLKMITRESDGESLTWYRSAAGIIFNYSLFEYFSIQQITLIYI